MKATGEALRSSGGYYVNCHCHGSPRVAETNWLHGDRALGSYRGRKYGTQPFFSWGARLNAYNS